MERTLLYLKPKTHTSMTIFQFTLKNLLLLGVLTAAVLLIALGIGSTVEKGMLFLIPLYCCLLASYSLALSAEFRKPTSVLFIVFGALALLAIVWDFYELGWVTIFVIAFSVFVFMLVQMFISVPQKAPKPC